MEEIEINYFTRFFVSYTAINNEGGLLMGNAIAQIPGQLPFLTLDNVHTIHAAALSNAVKTHNLDVSQTYTFTVTALIPLGVTTDEEFFAKP